MNFRALSVGLPLAALLGGANAANAQLPAEPVPQVEEEVTVTATAAEEKTADVPTSVDVVGAAEIAARKLDDATDLLRTLPGLDVVQSGSRGKSTTLFTRGTNSNHTLVLWNGVELNDPNLGAFDFSTLALDGVERVEVVRGPYSALYGSGALGGVVQLVTRREPGERRLSFRAEAGSNDYLRGGVAAAFSLGPVAIDLAGHLRRGDGEVDNDFYDGEEIDLGAELPLGEAVRLGLLVRDVGSEIGIPFDFAGAPSPEREQELDGLSLALPFSWTFSSGELALLAARTESEVDFRDPLDPFAASRSEASRDQGRASVRFGVVEGLEATVGGEVERQEATTSSAFGPGLADDEQEEWAAFAQLSWRSGPFRFDAGARHDDNDAFGAETSLRAAAAWAPDPRFRLRAGYGEAFRAPSLADLYFPGFGNPDLQPERSESFELGLDGELGEANRWRWNLALFENDIDDLVEFDFTTFLPQNIGRARARGIEGSLGLRAGIVDAQIAATWLDGENLETGGELLRRPEEKASLVLLARPGEWTAGATVRYVGDRVDFGDVALDAYSVVDLTLARAFGTRFEPFVRVENVFDEEYDEAAGFPAPGTAFTIGLDARF